MLMLLAVLALLEGVSMAPMMLEEVTMIGETALDSEMELYEILKEGLLNDTENLEKMREKFTLGPNEKRLCVRLNYTITCTDEEECDITNTHFNCSTFSNIWLSFNSSTWTGQILLEYAALNYEVLGLNWGEACDLSPEATLYLSINVSSLCDVDDVINDSLRILTTKVSAACLYSYSGTSKCGHHWDL